MFLVRFKYGFEKYLSLIQPTVVILERKSDTKEAEVPTISEIPDETVDLEMGYYHVVYVLLNFKRGGVFFQYKSVLDRHGGREVYRGDGGCGA